MKTGPKARSLLDRFMDKVSPEPNTGCWLWIGALSLCGYSRIGLGGHQGGMRPGHRIAWLLFRGEIPDGFEVAHKCDVRICVNPQHLWLATHADNMADMIRKGRHRAGSAFGDRNGSRTHPERRPRGDDHWTRRRRTLTDN